MALLWTSVEDVRGRWVGSDEFEAPDEKVSLLLEDAEDTILSEFPDIAERVERGEIPSQRVAKVAARVVIRHLRNPSGERSRSDMGGPFSQTVTYGGDDPGALYLTDKDREELRPVEVEAGKAFTIDQTPAFAASRSREEAWLLLGRTYV